MGRVLYCRCVLGRNIRLIKWNKQKANPVIGLQHQNKILVCVRRYVSKCLQAVEDTIKTNELGATSIYLFGSHLMEFIRVDWTHSIKNDTIQDSKVHVAHMGPTWVLSAPGGPLVGPINLAIWDGMWKDCIRFLIFHNDQHLEYNRNLMTYPT